MATSLELPPTFPETSPDSDESLNPTIRIGSLLLEPDTLELIDGDRVDVLRPLPAALLFHLLRHRHRIVPKEELHRVLWPDTSVSDAALASAVRDLRRILRDDGENQEIVRTFRGRGYRLVAPVEFIMSDSSESEEAPRPNGTSTRVARIVGRDRELLRFERLHRAALENGGGALLVDSVAGGGRTTFLEQCARATNGVLWLGVACSDEPWVPAYDTLARILLELEGAVGSPVFEEWVKHEPDIAHLLPDILPTEPGPEVRIEALSAAVRRLMDRASRISPVVVAIDDVHAIDGASLDLLCTNALKPAFLVASLDPARVFGGRRSRIDALFSQRSRLRLGGLSADEIAELAGDLPRSRRDAKWPERIRERTGGHPADVAAVLDEIDRATQQPGRASPLLPQVVFDRISRVIDGLSRPGKSLVTAAAALPPGVDLELIRLLASCDPEEEKQVDPVEECVQAGLLCLRAQPTRVELSGQFVRHVALAQISIERRRELERRAAEVLRQRI